jgi:hypothetical protein
MPNSTFGQVVGHIRQIGGMNEQVVALLESLNTLRNRNFGHGMVAAFNLSGPEVDFTYLTFCRRDLTPHSHSLRTK